MSSQGNSSSQHELYFFQDSDQSSGSTTTRVFFTENLDPILLEYFIRPSILDATSRPETIGSIDGYPHYISVRWLHVEVTLGHVTMQELEDEIKRILDTVLTQGFGWKSSVIRPLANSAEVRRTAAKFQVDWSRGKMPF